jgi:hypothetical protein
MSKSKSEDSTGLFEGGSSCEARIVPYQVDSAPRQNTFGGKKFITVLQQALLFPSLPY